MEAATACGRRVSISGMLKNLGVSRSGYRAFLHRKPSASQKRKEAIKETIKQIHDDSKQNYGAPKITQELRKSGECISERSYSHTGYPYDNACIESFHSLIKREWLNRFKIFNYSHAYRLVFEYIETFYNTVRIHSHCDYMSPNDFEKLYENLNQEDKQMLAS